MWEHAVHCWHVHFTSASSSLTAGISNRYLGGGVRVCACTQPENLLCTHKQTRKYSMGVGWVRFQSMRVHLSPWNLPQHPHYSSPGWGGDKWPTSTDLVLFICLCFSSIFIIPAPAAAFLVSADIFTAFHLILLAGGPRPSYMHIY